MEFGSRMLYDTTESVVVCAPLDDPLPAGFQEGSAALAFIETEYGKQKRTDGSGFGLRYSNPSFHGIFASKACSTIGFATAGTRKLIKWELDCSIGSTCTWVFRAAVIWPFQRTGKTTNGLIRKHARNVT